MPEGGKQKKSTKLSRWLARWFPPWNPEQLEQLEQLKQRDKRSWIGNLFRIFGRHYIFGGIAIGLFIYLGGLVGAVTMKGPGFHAYLHSRIWALAAVIGWVSAWGEWSDRGLFNLPKHLEHAFRTQLPDWKISEWRARFYDARRDLTAGGVLFIGISILTICFPSFWHKRLPQVWYQDRAASEGILIFYWFAGCLLAMTMLYGFWNYVCFANAMLNRELTSDLVLARIFLERLTWFGLATGVGWSVAVALMAEFFGHQATTLTLTLIVGFALLGFLLILLPQWLAHHALTRARDVRAMEVSHHLRGATSTDWLQQFVLDPTPQDVRIRSFIDAIPTASSWIYSPAQAVAFLFEVGGAVASVLAHLP